MDNVKIFEHASISLNVTNESGQWRQYENGMSVFYAKGSRIWEPVDGILSKSGALSFNYKGYVMECISMGKKGFIAHQLTANNDELLICEVISDRIWVTQEDGGKAWLTKGSRFFIEANNSDNASRSKHVVLLDRIRDYQIYEKHFPQLIR